MKPEQNKCDVCGEESQELRCVVLRHDPDDNEGDELWVCPKCEIEDYDNG